MKKDDGLRQIKELLEIIKHKVDMMEVSRTGQSASFHLMKDQQSVMNEKLDIITKDLDKVKQDLQEVKETQEEQVLPSVISTETTVTGYADAYKTNKSNIERLDSRVAELEDKASIIPPQEFTIQR